ncbi:alpha/beta fold hydrolase [Bacillus sp. ISL-41]|uniref:alpha/beta fold hydrolase n=1 Tax=Bacillus sp. ISL-41 TaxID=2819127 RepID=UPI001BE67129|nr:alpha/beta fold hydrolase [Bacillus sp. ISL-41]MBT2644996.1 alpha/beta fold hydrolase [Bacillus sp. ISL-41]
MWQQRLVQTERGHFEVFVAGEGEPLCVTHLYSEFNHLGNYFADLFADNFTVYLVNLKEAGKSARVQEEDELSMSQSVEDLEAIRKALGFKKWNFGGHSTGGMLGLVYAAQNPGSLKSLMVGGASATNQYMEHRDSIYSIKNPANKRLKKIFSILKSSESTREARMQAGREWTEMSLFDPSRFDEYFSKPSSGKVVQQRLDYFSYKELPSFDIRQAISKIDMPTIVYCGRHDSQCPFVFSEEIHHLIPASKFYFFEKSNHSPFLEEKGNFKEMIKDFSEMSNGT